ncbi:MAG: NADH-quinone oxidoreductase subunit C, partial [Fervidicoccaceae archaeon]
MGGRPLENVVTVEPEGLREAVEHQVKRGYGHLVTITGVDAGEKIRVLYHLSSLSGDMTHLEVSVPKKVGASLPTIADVIPGSLFYEMEVRDLFGVRFEGNPWEAYRYPLPETYPRDATPPLWKEAENEKVREIIWRDGDALGQIQTSAEGVSVPFGPYHPALKEPEHFRLIVDGETVVDVIPRLGYVHRGIEKIAERRTYLKNVYLFERVCGICSFIHTYTYVLAAESVAKVEPSRRAEWLRTLVAELERVHSHLLWIGLVGYWMGFDTMFMWLWGVREKVMDVLEIVCGNRVMKGFATIGGTVRDVTDSQLEQVKRALREIEKQASDVMERILSFDLFIHRTRGFGEFDVETARRMCAVGPYRRITGDPYDIRKVEPYGAYQELGFEPITEKRADAYHSVLVRLKETMQSIEMCRRIAEELPAGAAVPQRFYMASPQPGEAVARTEAPRGELFYFIKSAGKPTPDRVKVRTPSLANMLLAATLLRGATLSDVPIIFTMIDPCFSCTDRVLVYDVRTRTARM